MARRTVPGGGKLAYLNMRVTPDMRRRLEKACGQSGLSIAGEVSRRVDISFEADGVESVLAVLAEVNGKLDAMADSHAAICKLLVMLGCEGEDNSKLLHRALKKNGEQPHGR